jgi:nucleolin
MGKSDKKATKKVVVSSSSDSDSDSSSSESVKPVKKVGDKRARANSAVSAKSAKSNASKASAKAAPAKKAKVTKKESSSDSDSDSSESVKKAAAPKKEEKKPVKKAPVVSDSDSDSESEKPAKKAPVKKAAVKKAASSSDSDDSSESEKPAPKKAAAKKAASSSDSDDSSESEKPAPKKADKKAKKAASSDSESEAAEEEAKEEAVVDMAAVNVKPEDEGKVELFVGRISQNTWEATLRTLFEAHGTLVKCKHLHAKGVAFIEYESHENAAKAQAATNGAEVDGAYIDVQFSGDKPGAAEGTASGTAGESNTVFCGNCSFRTEEWAIKQFFEQIGEVAAVRIAMNDEGRPKGFAHIEFANAADAAKAVQDLNG